MNPINTPTAYLKQWGETYRRELLEHVMPYWMK